MLVLRLQRTGRKNLATYRIVLAEKARAVKGNFKEIVGHYLPTQKTPTFSVDKERVEHWIKLGAVPSDTLARLLKRDGMKGMEKFVSTYAKQKSKKAPPEQPAAPAAPVAQASVAETPAPTEAPAETAPVDAPAEPAAETPASTGDNA